LATNVSQQLSSEMENEIYIDGKSSIDSSQVGHGQYRVQDRSDQNVCKQGFRLIRSRINLFCFH